MTEEEMLECLDKVLEVAQKTFGHYHTDVLNKLQHNILTAKDSINDLYHTVPPHIGDKIYAMMQAGVSHEVARTTIGAVPNLENEE